MRNENYATGDWVVYRKSKMGTHPGPRALHVNPSSKGERYSYVVEKYWVVDEVLADGQLELITRRGKRHVIDAHDPNLRHAGWICRWMYRERFLAIIRSNTEMHVSDESGNWSGDQSDLSTSQSNHKHQTDEVMMER